MSFDGIITSEVASEGFGVTPKSHHDCDKTPDPCVLFAPEHDYKTNPPRSVVRTITNDAPLFVKAFNLEGDEKIVVEMGWGRSGGYLWEDLKRNGRGFFLSKENNNIVLHLPGLYRFRFEGGADGTTGEAIVVCEHTTCCVAEIDSAYTTGDFL